MSKFYLFSFQSYEENGGIHDLDGKHDTIEDAEQALIALRSGSDLAHIGTINDDGDLVIVAEYKKTNRPLLPSGELGHLTHNEKGVYRWLREGRTAHNYAAYTELNIGEQHDTTR